MLDVRRLRLLVELSRRGTLAAVAEALAYSPSSVSQQLSQLEKEVGVPLLVQVGRRAQLTPQAELLVGHAQAVLERLEEAEADVAREPGRTPAPRPRTTIDARRGTRIIRAQRPVTGAGPLAAE